MAKIKRGEGLSCIPCGRELLIDCWGASEKVIMCCGRPMKKAGKRKTTKKASKKK